MNETIKQLYARKSVRVFTDQPIDDEDKKQIIKLMNASDNMSNDVGTILFGKEAVEVGIIDEVGGVSRAIGEIRERIEGSN